MYLWLVIYCTGHLTHTRILRGSVRCALASSLLLYLYVDNSVFLQGMLLFGKSWAGECNATDPREIKSSIVKG